MDDRIRLSRPSFGDDELEALRRALTSGWVGCGPRVAEFEQRFAAYLGVRHAIALNSATAALHLAMLAAGVEGGEVLTTPMTFVSSNHAILLAGGRPVFCDIEPDTLNLDPEEVRRKVTPATRAVLVVHYGGHACDLDPILELARERGLRVIEDAAHACGGRYRGRLLGTLGHLGCFSFQATKNVTTGDGGMLVTDDDDVAARVRRLRWVGISRPTWERFQPGRPRHSWIYSVDEVGFKYEMNDLAASLGLVQLGKVEENNERRRRLLARYRRAFASVPAVEMLATRDYALSSCYNAVVKIDERDRLYEHLDRHGIDANVHYYPNHLFSVYRPYATPLPVAEAEWQRILSIPLYTDLREEDQDRVIACIAAFAEERRPAATGSATP